MPPRVVTADIETHLGVPVIAVVGVPYRPGLAIPAPLQGGQFIDVLAVLPPGTADGGALDTHVYEATSTAPARLTQLNDGALHEIWGWPKRDASLDPGDPDDAAVIASSRVQCIMYDLGSELNWRVNRVRSLSVGNGRVVAEMEVESPGNSASRPTVNVFDALDEHPPALRAIVELSPWLRRETASDPAPGWNDRKPDTP